MEDVIRIGEKLGISFDKFDAGQFADGINTEIINSGKIPGPDLSEEELLVAGRTALSHLNEVPDYYIRLQRKEMEKKGYYNKD